MGIIKKIKRFISSLLNMISKRRVINRLKEGGHFTNDIHWIKRKHLFNWHSLDRNGRIWTISLKNKTDQTQKVSLFSVIQDPLSKNSNGIIEIDVPESSYDSIRTDLISSVFHVQKMHVVTNNSDQFKEPIFLASGESVGTIEKRRLCLDNYIPKQDNQKNAEIIEIDNFWLRLDKHSFWEIALLPNTEMSILLTFFAIINVDRVLFNFEDIYNYAKTHNHDYFVS